MIVDSIFEPTPQQVALRKAIRILENIKPSLSGFASHKIDHAIELLLRQEEEENNSRDLPLDQLARAYRERGEAIDSAMSNDSR